MGIEFQYNKTYLQQLDNELRMRVNALPTLVAKESALRLEVKKAREAAVAIEERLSGQYKAIAATGRLWNEFPGGIMTVQEVVVAADKIAGVRTPVLKDVVFSIDRYSPAMHPAWIPQGVELLQKTVRLRIEADLARKKIGILEYARKKTTQKVNLYEKVQIPGYREAIRKIKRFMEDEDNLSKSSQKILKARFAAMETVS